VSPAGHAFVVGGTGARGGRCRLPVAVIALSRRRCALSIAAPPAPGGPPIGLADPAAQAAADAAALAQRLYALLRAMDPARARRFDAEAAKAELAALQGRAAEASGGAPGGLAEALATVAAQIDGAWRALDSAGSAREGWRAVRVGLGPAYEALVADLRGRDHHLPSLRPTNHARSLFHAAGGLTGVLLVELLAEAGPMRVAAFSMAAWAWSMELGRRASPAVNRLLITILGPVAHAHEAKRVNSATWFSSALVVLALLGSAPAAAVALAILGFADPAAGLVGRRWGRTPLVHGRSLEGSTAFFAVAMVVSVAVMRIFHPEIGGVGLRLGLALGAAAPATLAELFARRIDDNLAVPAAAAVGWLGAWALLAG